MSWELLAGQNCLIGGSSGITVIKYWSRSQENHSVDVVGFERILQLERLRWKWHFASTSLSRPQKVCTCQNQLSSVPEGCLIIPKYPVIHPWKISFGELDASVSQNEGVVVFKRNVFIHRWSDMTLSFYTNLIIYSKIL